MFSLLVVASTAFANADQQLPNILLILADDLGYGDVGCYNDRARVPTPNIDALAAGGLRFTDAHSPSTVCTPTRYSVLTGRMAFRTGFRGVFTGAGGPCLIELSRLTLPGMLREFGYSTACIGKWHVGMTFLDQDGEPICENGLDGVRRIDFSKPIPDAPIHRGFDQFFGTACCPTTDWLYAWIEGDRVLARPTQLLDRSELPKHAYSHDNRRGMIAPDFDLEEVDLVLLERSQEFLRRHAAQSPEKPFFLFHSTQAVHLPSFAAEKFQGASAAGPHGDFLAELDHIVGQLLLTLEQLQMADRTLVIFTSDNGPEVSTTLHMRTEHRHDGARPWRGLKRDNWEGGHRVPLITRWPQRIAAGETTDQTICLTDIMATCAAIVGAPLPNDAAEDSFDFLPVLEGRRGDDQPIRRYTLHQTNRLALAIRCGPWKYLDHPGSGGNDYDRPALVELLPEPTAEGAPAQLYNLAADPTESRNLYFERPKIVRDLKSLLDAACEDGRSAPTR